MKKINFGIIAHVDSGKTTLSEAMLYISQTIRRFGRVDKGESFLDGGSVERRRGITIYSKQARFSYADTAFTLLDTPGHSDFSAEMERTLAVCDYCVLLISALDGIKGQTEVLWNLLKEYEIPTFIFVNKMDQSGADAKGIMLDIRAGLSDQIVDFTNPVGEAFYDAIAMCSEAAMEEYLESGVVSDELIADMIADRQLFPTYFGSALNMDGVELLMHDLAGRTLEPEYPDEFGARVYKIMRDNAGGRLTLMKITGGSLKARDSITDGDSQTKVNQIRLYSGEKFTPVAEVVAGDICAVDSLHNTYAGQGIGIEAGQITPVLMPVLSYRVLLEHGVDAARVLPHFRTIEEESPELQLRWDEEHSEIYVCVMGEVQLEILTEELKTRFELNVSFDTGKVLYAETISGPTVGVGHFEPLRHYSEVHLLMEPLPAGSGLEFAAEVSTDALARNWQRLILTHLCEKTHRGVLVGAPITDMRITIVGGRAHLKHTEGGDFRQSTYRAVRQGLMNAKSVLLEPYYSFIIELPTENVGRAMTDLGGMNADFSGPETLGDGAKSRIRGRVPVAAFSDYARVLAAYTAGLGSVSISPDGYGPCHNPEEVITNRGYVPTEDLRNTPDSVFCAHGAGYVVPWNEVFEHMHVPFSDREKEVLLSEGVQFSETGVITDESEETNETYKGTEEIWLGTEEIDAIISGISRSNTSHKAHRPGWKRHRRTGGYTCDGPFGSVKESSNKKVHVFDKENTEYLLVDGYNVVFAWDDLNELAKVNIDSARDKLLDVMCDYQGMSGCEVIVVFDAYRVKGHKTEYLDFHNIHVVYTAEAETADAYIERFAHENARKKRVTVVTSDGLEQIIIRGEGCALISSREFEKYYADKKQQFKTIHGVT